MNETTLTNPFSGKKVVKEAITAGRKGLDEPHPTRETQTLNQGLGVNHERFAQMAPVLRRAASEFPKIEAAQLPLF